jgi:hypothetical protein
VHLLSQVLIRFNSCLSLPSDAGQRAHHVYHVWLHITAIRGLHQTERTLLCMWMVYSRATTSSMALRPWAPVLPAAALLDLEALGMATVLTVYRMSSIGSR